VGKLKRAITTEAAMFYPDRLNDDYEKHQRQIRYLTRDDLDILLADATVARPPWYAGILARLGDGLIAAGSTIKERNHGASSPRFSRETR
jgi:hypothetical protein